MKKNILTIVIAVLAICAFSASARDNNRQDRRKANRTEQTCNKNNSCELFKGIELTADQQTALKELNEQNTAKRPEMGKRPERGQRPDSAQMAQMRQARQNALRTYLDGVKRILTPEQYVVYLENCYLTQSAQMGPRPEGPQRGHRK